MSNCCMTDITINAYTKEQVEGLKKIADIISTDCNSKSSDRGWLGNIVLNAGLGHESNGFIYDLESKRIPCRGKVVYHDLSCDDDYENASLSVSVEDANGPHITVWRLLRDNLANGAEIIYVADTDGESNILTNDITISGLYMLDIYDNNSSFEAGKELSNDSYYELTEEDIVKKLNSYYGTNKSHFNDFTSLIDEGCELTVKRYEQYDVDELLYCIN